MIGPTGAIAGLAALSASHAPCLQSLLVVSQSWWEVTAALAEGEVLCQKGEAAKDMFIVKTGGMVLRYRPDSQRPAAQSRSAKTTVRKVGVMCARAVSLTSRNGVLRCLHRWFWSSPDVSVSKSVPKRLAGTCNENEQSTSALHGSSRAGLCVGRSRFLPLGAAPFHRQGSDARHHTLAIVAQEPPADGRGSPAAGFAI